MAQRLGAVDVEADALATWGILPSVTPEEGLKALRRAAELAEEAGFLDLAARAHNNLSTIWYHRLGDMRASHQHRVRLLALDRQIGDIAGEIHSLWGSIIEAIPMGSLDEAAAYLLRMRRLADELDDPGAAFWMLANGEARILWYRGDWANAARLARQSLLETRRSGNVWHEAFCSGLLAEALLEAHFVARESSVHEWDEAECALTRALEIWEVFPDWFEAAWCRCLLSALLASRGRFEEARSHLDEATMVARQRPGTRFEAVFLWAEGRLASAEGRWPEAGAAFEAMVGLFDKLGQRPYWARSLMGWSEALTAGGEPADLVRARELLREAQAAFEEMGIPRYAALARDRLEAL
jgi:tetratricopeptide (TPR) repeat protein